MWLLTRKTAQQVADGLQEKVFAVFGPPKIFQSDNGREFVNDILREVLKMWGNKDVLFVNGRLRHCQSQGLVEQGNYSIGKQIANKRTELGMENQPCPWAKWLPEIQLTLNTMKSEATKHTAYELVFGQPFRSNIFPGARPAGGHILLEEDYDEEMAATARKSDLKSQEEQKDGNQEEQKDGNQEEQKDGNQEEQKDGNQEEQEDGNQEEQKDGNQEEQKDGNQEELEDGNQEEQEDGNQEEQEDMDLASYGASGDNSSECDFALRKHMKVRAAADRNYQENAQHMKIKYSKRKRTTCSSFQEGDLVTMKIPKLDRC